jgi:nucleoside-diphosphate-sugar epimerase
MRVLVAGGSGAIGARLVPQLIDRGHEVIGTARSPGKAQRLHALGAKQIVLDLLDPRAVRKAVLDTKPRRDRPPGDRAHRPQ